MTRTIQFVRHERALDWLRCGWVPVPMPLHVQIVETRLNLQRAKPRSIRHAELELRLRDFVCAQLKFENRLDKKRSQKADHEFHNSIETEFNKGRKDE